MKVKNFFVDLPLKSHMLSDDELIEYGDETIKEELKKMDPEQRRDFFVRKDLEVINGLNKNGPIKKLAPSEINTRSIIIIGIEPTSKMSIHPEGDCNGKDVRILTQIAKKYPGVPMMTGHRLDKTPWGRTFRASIISGMKGFDGPVVKNDYWFLNDDEGNGIARKIDGGIWSEGSIQYSFKEARCSLCHKPMAYSFWYGKQTRCKHKIGEKDPDTGKVCYWYPSSIHKVIETSYVFAGAYPKTKSMTHSDKGHLSECYSHEDIESGIELEKQLIDCGLSFKDESEENNGNEDSSTANKEGREHINVPGKEGDDNSESNNQESSEDSDSQGKTGDESGNAESNKTSDSSSSSEGNSGSDNGGSESGTNSGENSGGSEGNSEGDKTGTDSGDSEGNSEGESGDSKSSKNGEKSKENEEENQEKINSDETNSEDSEENSDGKKKAIDTTQVQEKTESGENVHEGTNTPDTGSESQENSGKSAPEGNNVGTENKDGDDEGTSETESLEKYQVIIDEITQDSELSNDEKEEAIREEMAECSPELINSALELIKKKVDIEPKKVVYSCISCENRFESKVEKCDCDGEIVELKDFTVVLFDAVGKITPEKSGENNNDFFDKNNFSELNNGKYYVEPYYDGIHMELHKKSGEVKLLGLDGQDYTEKFPGVVEECKLISSDNFLVIGTMTKWRGRKRLKYEDVISYLDNDKSTEDGHTFKFKAFDALIVDNENISMNAFSERKEKIDSLIKTGKRISPTAYNFVEHKKGEEKIIGVIDDRKTREGVLVIEENSKYSIFDSSSQWLWKEQFDINCKIIKVKELDEDNYSYTCSVGRGKNSIEIGETFPTKLKLSENDFIRVSVDHIRYDEESDNKYSWFAPKIVSLRKDISKPDPISTLKKISELKNNFSEDQNYASLSEVIPLLQKIELKNDIYLTGIIVKNGVSTENIDIVTKEELSEGDIEIITVGLGERLGRMLKVVHNPEGPDGSNVIIESKQKQNKFEYSDQFVIQRHSLKDTDHYDIRFGDLEKDSLWGFVSLFSIPDINDGSKSQCHQLKDHDTKWMTMENNDLPNGTMISKKDNGKYELVKSTENFVEVNLHGEKFSGRYIFRKISVKSDGVTLHDDDVGVKNNTLWIVSKPKNQELKSPVNKLAYKYSFGCLTYWETEEFDTDID